MDLNDRVTSNYMDSTSMDLNGQSDNEGSDESFFTGVYEDEDRQWWVVCPDPLTAVSCSTSEKIRVCPSDSRWGKWKKVTYTDKLSKGTTTPSPCRTPCALEMRSRFNGKMIPYLGKSGTVVDVLEDAVRMEINGAKMLFDLDLFPKTIERVCLEGSCSLEPFLTSDTSFSCTSCLSQFGEGTPLFKCNDHTHTLCLFCCGLEPGVKKGMKVFRGPTWLWKDQDGGEYKQGTVEEIDSKGQVVVRWDIDSSSTKWYRGPPFCDVVAAYDGKNIVPNTKTAVKREASSKKRNERRKKMYTPNKHDPELDNTKGHHLSVSNLLDSTKGYHLIHSTTGGGKVAVCSGPSTRTYVTEEILDSADLEERAIHFKVTMQNRAIVGISGQELQGREGLLGNQLETFALVLEAGTHKACFMPSGDYVSLPAKVKSGDVVSVVVKGKKKGAFVFMLNGALVNSYHTVKGPYRFGVSLDADGDRVEVLDNRKGEVSMEASVDVLEEYYFSNVDTGATILDNGKKAVKKTDGAETLYTTCVIEVGQEKTIHFIVEEYLTSFAVGVCGKVTGKGALGEIGGSLALHITRNSVDAELKYGGKTHPMKLSSVVSPGDQFSVTVAGGSREGTIVFGHMGNTYDSEKGIEKTTCGSRGKEAKGTFRFAACSFSSGDTLCICEIDSVADADNHPSYYEGNTMFQSMQNKEAHKWLELSDLEKSCNWAEDWHEIGKGTYGVVYKTKYLGVDVAVKVQKDTEGFHREVKMTEKLKLIPNAVEFIGVIPKEYMIVMKYYPDGDLQRYAKGSKMTKREDKYRMMHNLVKGLEAMTNMKIVHRDLKPENILIDDGKPVIADLGMAKNFDSILPCICGSPCYIAPEVWGGGVASEKSDVYSCAMIFYFVLSKKPPVIPGAKEKNMLKDYVRGGSRPVLSRLKSDPQAIEIIKQCWENEPSERPTFAKLLTMLETGMQPAQ